MSRINTNVASLIGQVNLQRSQSQLQTALTRLSTGLRINSGEDDPAGLIASQELGSNIATVQQAISNTNLANEVIATADGALGQVSTLLNNISGLVTASANTGALSADQIAANQLQVDSSLEAIDRIASTTSFQGRNLLDGSLGFNTSGISTTDLGSVNISKATIPSAGSLTVNISLTSAATKASVTGDSVPLANQAVIEVSGAKGSQVLTFGTGTTVDQITDAINLVSDSTGVAADSSSGAVVYTATDYGSANYVSLNSISGTFTGAGTRASGTDAVGNVNGTAFSAQGNSIALNTSSLDLQADLTTNLASGGSTSFNITGGGALFQIGPNIVSSQQARIGIESVNSAQLSATVNGSLVGLYELRSGQAANLATDPTTASEIVSSVINQITTLRGTLGAFQSTTLDSNLTSLNSTLTNLTQAQSNIQDADFAAETANLTRAQILVQSGTSVLKIANQTPQDVLSLLPSS